MKKLMTTLALGTFATLLGIAAALPADAQSNYEKSTLTVTEPLDVGPFTLEPGTYRLKVVMLASNRNMIQVTNMERTKVFASVLATPHQSRPDEVIPATRYIFYETASGQPKALRTWFAAETANGQDIIYPKKRALELAALAKQPVLAVPDDVEEKEYTSAPLLVVTPEQQVQPYEAPVVVAESRPLKRLPKTASHVPLFTAFGLVALGTALGLRAFSNRAR